VKSTDGGKTFGNPVLVADYYDLPDCSTYTGDDAGRACVPTAPLSNHSVFRASNYPTGISVDDNKIVVDFASFINPHSNPSNPSGQGQCSSNGFASSGFPLYNGVGDVNGCNNDILRSTSKNGGASFDGTTTPPDKLPAVNDEGSTLADQLFQSEAKGPNGEVVDAYMDRKYGTDQATGYMDVTMGVGTGNSIVRTRVTDASMPTFNEFPGSSGYGLFLGDYNGLAVGSDGIAHPAWPDTRNPIFTWDDTGATDARILTFAGYGADIYTASIPIGVR